MKKNNRSKENLIFKFFKINCTKTARRIAGVVLFIFMTLKASPVYCLYSSDMFFIIDSPAFSQCGSAFLAGNNIREKKCSSVSEGQRDVLFSGSWNTSSSLIAYELDKSTFDTSAFSKDTNMLNLLNQVVLIIVISIASLLIYLKWRILFVKGLRFFTKLKLFYKY